MHLVQRFLGCNLVVIMNDQLIVQYTCRMRSAVVWHGRNTGTIYSSATGLQDIKFSFLELMKP